MNRKGDEPRTLLHRLLRQVEAQGQSPKAAALPQSTKRRTNTEASPVRPVAPTPTEPPAEQIMPQPRATQTIRSTQTVAVEDRLKAEEALAGIRQKTAEIANEFAEGKLNRAQFSAMYTHFNEKRVIIERLLARDPDTQAWQSVARPGHTTFLRQHFEARVTSYSIYDNGVVDPDLPITGAGIPLPSEVAKPILTALAILLKTRTTAKPLRALRRQLDDGKWIAIIPGAYTSAIAVFSLEPSTHQFNLVVDLHRDFERANRVALERGIRVPDQFVFPHRALFEQPGH